MEGTDRAAGGPRRAPRTRPPCVSNEARHLKTRSIRPEAKEDTSHRGGCRHCHDADRL